MMNVTSIMNSCMIQQQYEFVHVFKSLLSKRVYVKNDYQGIFF